MKYTASTALAALLAIQPVQALANSDASIGFTLEGMVEQVCVMPDPNLAGATNASFGNGNTITVDEVMDDTTGTLNDASLTLTFPDMMCNYPARIVMRSKNGALKRTTNQDVNAVADSANFLEEIDYRVIGNWGSINFPEFATSDGGPNYEVEVLASGANKADLNLQFIINGTDEPVLLGTYRDTFTVEVGIAP